MSANSNGSLGGSDESAVVTFQETTTQSEPSQEVKRSPEIYKTSNADAINKVIEDLKPSCEDDSCEDKSPPLVLVKKKKRNIHLKGIKFADDIKIDFINSIDFRIMCRFLGITSVNEVKNHPYAQVPLITLILMQVLPEFMEHNEYKLVGELNFSRDGESIPPERKVWKIKGKEVSFIMTGFLYFESLDQNKKNNIVFFVYCDISRGISSITCYSTNNRKSKSIISRLEQYAKKTNILRGLKIRDINMYEGSFAEVETKSDYTWDNYYYPDNVKDIFELEVFGFLSNVKKYNKEGIVKRGIIIFGAPGTGKTTIGHIICNNVPDHTVIWITPESIYENGSRSSIKLLYMLADFVSPSILILEDLDLFAEDRDGHGAGDLRLGGLMNILDGVNSVSNAITIATTNRLESIEKALRNRPGRFDRIVEIPSLNDELRTKMFKNRLKKWSVSEETIKYIVDNSKDWTGAESQEFVITLGLEFIRSKKKNKIIDKKLAEKVIGTMKEFGIGQRSGKLGFGKK